MSVVIVGNFDNNNDYNNSICHCKINLVKQMV